ncbi:Ubiquinol oxidase 1 mitochondrial [Bienertia sinuspersici]
MTMMMTRTATRAARSALTNALVGPRYFSTTTAANALFRLNETTAYKAVSGMGYVNGGSGHLDGVVAGFFRLPVRRMSTATLNEGEEEKKLETGSAGGSAGGGSQDKELVSYWGVEPKKITKEDGTQWRWSCFMPWETYEADLSIDLKKHHAPSTILDKLAYWTVKSLRVPTDIFFQVISLLITPSVSFCCCRFGKRVQSKYTFNY